MTRRPGLTLVEVLAAIFIMGVGLVSIFTLFPYGALSMAQALRDDRTAQCAAAADGYMRWYWKDRIVEDNRGSKQFESFFWAMDDPNADPLGPGGFIPTPYPKPPGPFGTSPLSPTSTDPSYPVFVDPMGWVARANRTDGSLPWVAEQTANGGLERLPRRTFYDLRYPLPTPIPTPPFFLPPTGPLGTGIQQLASLRTCSMMDAMNFDPNGRAADATGQASETSGGTVARELRYNWLWVLQRPNNSNRDNVTQTVVVFDKRAHMFAPATAETAYVPLATGVPGTGDTRLQFDAANAPPVRKGSWLLDGTVVTRQFNPGGTVPPQWGSFVRNANFYRVLSVTESTPGVIDIELASPLKADSMSPLAPNGTEWIPPASVPVRPDERRFYVLSGLLDVYQRNPLTPAQTP